MGSPVSPQHFSSPDDRNEQSPSSAAQDTSIVTVNTLDATESPLATSDITGAINSAASNVVVTTSPGMNVITPVTVAGPGADLWRLLKSNPKVMSGLIIVLIFFLVALFGPLFIHVDPNAFDSSATFQPPSAHHLLGTTQTGQDIFAQLIVGTRSTILWSFLTGIVVTMLSIIVGLSAGYFGGVIDDILSLIINIFLVIPAFPLAIVLASFLQFRGDATLSLVIAITGWAWGARVLRSQTLSMRQRDFVEAARASGEKTLRIIFFEILPNEIGIVAANFIGTFTYVIGITIALEFLGLGDPTQVSWGNMFFWAQNGDALLEGAWWWFVAPGLCVAIVCTALALINFGIDEIANPRLRRESKIKLTTKRKVVA